MFKNRGMFSGLWKPKNPHSLDHLKYLYSVLYKNQTVTEANKSLLVETLRSIAEILIWGDQNDSTVFDFFLERNMLSFFLKIMNQKCGSYVCVQLLQTLNILFENIRNETSIYYLLSNNHVNSIIVHKFDFSDEEVMAYYISFLKTLSFRLNKHTIHFFYNEHTNDFPLYTEAIKFFNHGESMVRIAVRTLTLNVYRVEDDSMLRFVIDKTAVPYFANLVWFIGNHILEIDACVRNDADHRSMGRLKDLVAEHLDHLHYLNDILCLGIANLNEVLTGHLLNRLFIPLYIYSLVRNTGSSNSLEDMKPHVSKVTALFLLSQVFLIITHVPLVRLLAWIIFAGDANIFTERGATRIAEYSSTSKKMMAANPSCAVTSRLAVKPSFVAPSQPLEKSLKEHIQKTAGLADWEAKERPKKGHKKDKQQLSSQKKGQGIKEPSPTTVSSSSSTVEVGPSVTETAAFASLPELTGLSVGQEPSEDASFINAEVASTSEESDEACVGPITPKEAFSMENRPFLSFVFEALNCTENDYIVLFGICLLRAIQGNAGMSQALLESVRIPCSKSSSKEWYNVVLMEKLLHVLFCACQYGSKIRLVTLDLAIDLLKGMVVGSDGRSYLADTHFAELEGIREESTLLLRNFYKSEEIFLDMFEDEFRAATRAPPRVELVLSDASLILPPTVTPLTGIDFTKRLPCGEVERARRSIRTFFRLRQLSLDIQGRLETRLPLSSPDTCIQVQDVLDLNNSDLLAVTVSPSSRVEAGQPSRLRRFLVVDVYQIVLVEPDSTRLGWGVATFVGFLQDLEVVTDKEDSRCLHVTVHSPGGSCVASGASPAHVPVSKTAPLLSATFTFDDHIRCMAAKQRLTKGRVKARQRKMHQIARLLELPGNVGPSCPSPPTSNLTSVRQYQDYSRRGSSGGAGSSSSPRSRATPERRPTGGSYRPLFGNTSKVPGAAALLRNEATRRSPRTTQNEDTTTNTDHELDHDETAIEALESEMKEIDHDHQEDFLLQGLKSSSTIGVQEATEAIAMSRLDKPDENDGAKSEGEDKHEMEEESAFEA